MAEKANAANPASAVDWSIPNAADFAKKEKLARAVMILSNYQLLMKYALANNQSIPATRLYFEKVAAGASPNPIIRNWFDVVD